MGDLALRLIEEGRHPGPYPAAVQVVRTWRNRGRLPDPSGYVGRTPYWNASTINRYWRRIVAGSRNDGGLGGSPRPLAG